MRKDPTTLIERACAGDCEAAAAHHSALNLFTKLLRHHTQLARISLQVLLEEKDAGVPCLRLLCGDCGDVMRAWIRAVAERLQRFPLNVAQAEGGDHPGVHALGEA